MAADRQFLASAVRKTSCMHLEYIELRGFTRLIYAICMRLIALARLLPCARLLYRLTSGNPSSLPSPRSGRTISLVTRSYDLQMDCSMDQPQHHRELYTAPLHVERLHYTYDEYKTAHPEGGLCERCAGINWSNLLLDEAVHYCQQGICELLRVPESSQQLSASSCPLCQLLGSDQVFGENTDRTLQADCVCRDSVYLDYDGRYTPDYGSDLTQHAPRVTLVDRGGSAATPCYMLQETCGSAKNYLVRKLDPGDIDYSTLRHWLDHCKLYHTTGCNQPYQSPIPGLRVIDCNTNQIVATLWDSPVQYVALSYVWGGTRASGERESSFPATICDAITVTLKLGYRYLWVDQYVCFGRLIIETSKED
jgi:hypothetical protein